MKPWAVNRSHTQNPGERVLQKTLAREVTDIVHGRERRESVERVTAALFGGNVNELGDDDIEALAVRIPTVIPQNATTALVKSEGVASSNGEARRLIQGGAIIINGIKITEDTTVESKSLKVKIALLLLRWNMSSPTVYQKLVIMLRVKLRAAILGM